MTPRVIILAQGQQARLAQLGIPKQLLPLPSCGGAPIIGRTARMIRKVCHHAEIHLVARPEIADAVMRWDHSARCRMLPDPGTSSLVGLWRHLEGDLCWDGRTTVLLGDVCYSWSCLSALLLGPSLLFAGTHDLGADRGELWGVAWDDADSDLMTLWMRDALARHPAFSDYQCGQMRQWLFAARNPTRQDRSRPAYESIDDYTMDFDVPTDLSALDAVSESARCDDLSRGMTWADRDP